MSTQKSGTGALVVIIIFVLFIIMIFPIGRFVLLRGFHGGFHLPGLFSFSDHIHGFPFPFMPALIMLAIWLAIGVWVYTDAERKGMSGILWALLVFVGNIVGLIIYLIVRSGAASPATAPSSATNSCPSCKSPVQADFKLCPNCGTNLKEACPKCKKNVQPNWNVCPYCGEALRAGSEG